MGQTRHHHLPTLNCVTYPILTYFVHNQGHLYGKCTISHRTGRLRLRNLSPDHDITAVSRPTEGLPDV